MADQLDTAPQIADTELPIDAPVDWKIDQSTGRVIFPLEYVRGSEAVAQRVGIKMRLFIGEWFANRIIGMPWFVNDFVSDAQAVLGDRFELGRAEAMLRRETITTLGVSRVTGVHVTFDRETRAVRATIDLVTVYNENVTVQIQGIAP